MKNWWRKLTGVHIYPGDSLEDAIKKANKLPWWWTKKIVASSIIVRENITVPPNIEIWIEGGTVSSDEGVTLSIKSLDQIKTPAG